MKPRAGRSASPKTTLVLKLRAHTFEEHDARPPTSRFLGAAAHMGLRRFPPPFLRPTLPRTRYPPEMSKLWKQRLQFRLQQRRLKNISSLPSTKRWGGGLEGGAGGAGRRRQTDRQADVRAETPQSKNGRMDLEGRIGHPTKLDVFLFLFFVSPPALPSPRRRKHSWCIALRVRENPKQQALPRPRRAASWPPPPLRGIFPPGPLRSCLQARSSRG